MIHGGKARTAGCLWKPEDSLQNPFSFLLYMCSRDETCVTRLSVTSTFACRAILPTHCFFTLRNIIFEFVCARTSACVCVHVRARVRVCAQHYVKVQRQPGVFLFFTTVYARLASGFPVSASCLTGAVLGLQVHAYCYP